MKLFIKREDLLRVLQLVIGVVERRQAMPILANVLLLVKERVLLAIATDLEVELSSSIPLSDGVEAEGALTVSGRKLIDICRSLPADSELTLEERGKSLSVRSGNSHFDLATLPAADFPRAQNAQNIISFPISQKVLLSLVKRTHFAIAENHAHHYLNGLLLNIEKNSIHAVASDGHRMSLYSLKSTSQGETTTRVIIPKKGATELMRLLVDSEDQVTVELTKNYIRVLSPNFTFTSKLIDSKYPDYNKLIPRGGDKRIVVNCESFRRALARISILSNEILRSMHLELSTNMLRMTTHNAEQEQAEEVIHVDYSGDNLDIGFNIAYLMDILSTIKTEEIAITLKNSKSGATIEEISGHESCLYVIMPFQI